EDGGATLQVDQGARLVVEQAVAAELQVAAAVDGDGAIVGECADERLHRAPGQRQRALVPHGPTDSAAGPLAAGGSQGEHVGQAQVAAQQQQRGGQLRGGGEGQAAAGQDAQRVAGGRDGVGRVGRLDGDGVRTAGPVEIDVIAATRYQAGAPVGADVP